MNEHKQDRFELKLEADRRLIHQRGGSVRHIVATITPPDQPEPNQKRPAQNISIVIDRSGSMQGDRLQCAKEAARGVARSLSDDDTLSIVAFDNDAITVIGPTQMNEDGRQAVEQNISSLQTAGCTNLFAGFLLGAEHVARVMEGNSETVNRVIIMSDGMANQGELNLERITHHVRELASRGIVTSTVGIGAGYDSRFLQAMSEAGGGDMHDAEHPGEIIETVMGELHGAVRQCASRSELEIVVEACRKLEVVGFSNARVSDQADGSVRHNFSLGALFHGRTRRITLRATFGGGEAGIIAKAQGHLRVKGTSDNDVTKTSNSVGFEFTRGQALEAQVNDLRVTEHAAIAVRDMIQAEAANLNRHGNADAIRRLVGEQEHLFRRLITGLPNERDLLDDLEVIRGRADRHWGERTIKEMELMASKGRMSSADFRTESRPHWKGVIR
jgi:Ca-activated chloride channel homolog